MKRRWLVLAQKMPTTERGWECASLKWMKMLTDGLNLRSKVSVCEVAMYYGCFQYIHYYWVKLIYKYIETR